MSWHCIPSNWTTVVDFHLKKQHIYNLPIRFKLALHNFNLSTSTAWKLLLTADRPKIMCTTIWQPNLPTTKNEDIRNRPWCSELLFKTHDHTWVVGCNPLWATPQSGDLPPISECSLQSNSARLINLEMSSVDQELLVIRGIGWVCILYGVSVTDNSRIISGVT